MSLNVRSVIVTGGSRGLGLEIARQFVDSGYRVLLVARNISELESARDALRTPGQVEILAGDVSLIETAQSAVDIADKKWSGPGVLVNNAGIGTAATLADTTPDLWDRMMAVNARGTYLMCREAAARMTAKKIPGRIVNVSSVSGSIGSAMASAYSASKAAVLGFSKAIARELAPYGINVNCVCPGMIETGPIPPAVKRIPFKETGGKGRRPEKTNPAGHTPAAIPGAPGSRPGSDVSGLGRIPGG